MNTYSYIHAHCMWPLKQINLIHRNNPITSEVFKEDSYECDIEFITSVRLKRKNNYYKVIVRHEVGFVSLATGKNEMQNFLKNIQNGLDTFEETVLKVKYLWALPEPDDLAKKIEHGTVVKDFSHLSNKAIRLYNMINFNK